MGLLPPTTSVNNGSGAAKVCASAVAAGAVVSAGLGTGDAAGTGVAVVAEEPAADGVAVAVGVGEAVEAGAGVVSARAGESVTAVSEARVTTNAVRSAVVFRIEFTFCLS